MIEYFRTKPNHGLFLRMDSITVEEDASPPPRPNFSREHHRNLERAVREKLEVRPKSSQHRNKSKSLPTSTRTTPQK